VSGPRNFDPERWLVSDPHSPTLHGAVATFKCRTVSRVPAGDHVVFLGEVLEFTYTSSSPLLFHAGRFFESDELLGSRDSGSGKS